MNIEQISFQIENSPTLKLLRSKHASLALAFFHATFKATTQFQIPFGQLKDKLARYLEHHNLGISEEPYPIAAARYLDAWCDDQHRFLRKYYELNQDEPITELTADAERALEWLYSLEKREFVGTGSRFFAIFENMKRIVEQTEEDPKIQLARLKQQQKKIDQEIQHIQTTNIPTRMDSTQIRERFLHILDDSRKLISEFRLVEDIFKDLTRQIKEQKLKESITKGNILGQVLDAHDLLEESDQGKSFGAFWNFIVSDDNQLELKKLSEKILKIQEINVFVKQNSDRQMDNFLRKFKGHLLQAGQKVLRSKFRLSEELRKLLQQRALAENKRVLELTASIKKLLIENKTLFLGSRHGYIELQDCATLKMPLSRPLWKPSTKTRFSNMKPDMSEMTLDQDYFQELISQHLLSEGELEKRIQIALEQSGSVSLPDLVMRYPISEGLSEVLGYLTLAMKTSSHQIDTNLLDRIPYTVPHIEFSYETR